MGDLIYNVFKMGVMAGTFNLQNATLKVALCNNSYSPDIDAHEFFSDLSGETAGAGYTAGGHALSAPALTTDDTNDMGVLDAADWSIANVTLSGTGTVRYGVLYDSTGAAAACPLICCFDFVTDQTVTSGTFTIQWAAEGLINLT